MAKVRKPAARIVEVPDLKRDLTLGRGILPTPNRGHVRAPGLREGCDLALDDLVRRTET